MRLSRNGWKALFFTTIIILGLTMACGSWKLTKEYDDLNDSYQDEKAIADMMEEVIATKNQEIADLNKQIEELEAKLPQ